ncbi:MAG: hypothetical protein FWE67_07625 [Planctomycetaceae bacterium]|nr:hypothetical protein [Planctomycetaceae bacterium]
MGSRHGNSEEVMKIGQTIQEIAEEIGQLAERAARTISGADDWSDEHWGRLNGEVNELTSPIRTQAGNLAEIASRITSEASHYE